MVAAGGAAAAEEAFETREVAETEEAAEGEEAAVEEAEAEAEAEEGEAEAAAASAKERSSSLPRRSAAWSATGLASSPQPSEETSQHDVAPPGTDRLPSFPLVHMGICGAAQRPLAFSRHGHSWVGVGEGVGVGLGLG